MEEKQQTDRVTAMNRTLPFTALMVCASLCAITGGIDGL